MDQGNQVTNNTSSLILDDSPSLDWVLARASKLFPKEGDISKTSLVFYQSPANFYAGSAVTQSGFGLSRMGRTRESSICMRDVAAPGLLKFLSQDKGQQLHKDLTHDMMGRTTLHDTRKKFYMEDASHTYRKYKDIRDKCVFYNKDWERVRPESGIFQTEQEMSDVLQALVESIWEREEEEHGRKKRVEGDSPRAEAPLANDDPSIDVTSPVHNGHNGYGEDLGPVMTPGMSPAGGVTPSRERKEEAIYAKKMPCDWLPQYFLSWIFWGPLSSNPDPRISTSTSCDPPKPINKKGEGSQASGGSASRVHSAENFKLKDPSGGVLPADPNGPLPMSRKKARQLKRKEREVKTEVLSPRASLADAIAKSSAQQAEVVAMLGRLNSALTQSMESDRRRQEMDMLREYIAIAEEEGDGDEVQKLRAKRRRLMRESRVGDAAHAAAAAGGENGGANGGASSELLDPVHLASRVQPAASVAAVGGGAATMGWENAATMGLVSAEGQAAGMAGAAGGAVGAVPESAEAWRLR